MVSCHRRSIKSLYGPSNRRAVKMTLYPVTTAKLKEGDFCLLTRSDGKFVPFIYICSRPHTRTSFFGAIADCVLETTKPEELPHRISVRFFALLHIHCFEKNATPIIGNLRSRLDGREIERLRREATGTTTHVWGYRTLYKYANQIGETAAGPYN